MRALPARGSRTEKNKKRPKPPGPGRYRVTESIK